MGRENLKGEVVEVEESPSEALLLVVSRKGKAKLKQARLWQVKPT
jgi:hypothetical protein